jgi:hypothetical protein
MGTPSATPEEPPILDVMSGRTMPSSSRTLGPLVPSAGKGPAVSSGISSPALSPPDVVALDAVVVAPALDVGEPTVVVVPDAFTPQAASRPARLRPPIMRSMSRRPTRAGTSR